MKVLDSVGALGCVGADQVLAVLTETGTTVAVSSDDLQRDEFGDESPAPPGFRKLHVGSSDDSR